MCCKHRDNQNEIESCEEMKQNIPDLHKVEEIYGDGVTEESAAVMEKVLKLKTPKQKSTEKTKSPATSWSKVNLPVIPDDVLTGEFEEFC